MKFDELHSCECLRKLILVGMVKPFDSCKGTTCSYLEEAEEGQMCFVSEYTEMPGQLLFCGKLQDICKEKIWQHCLLCLY